jgi:hypothetical protein
LLLPLQFSLPLPFSVIPEGNLLSVWITEAPMMKRWMKWLVAVVIISVGALGVADALLERSARRAATEDGSFRDFHDLTRFQLEQQVRSSLPIGSSRTAVESYLTKRGMEFSSDSSKNEIHAIARYLKDSNFIVRTDMGIEFHFDNTQRLQSIHTKIELTGP